MFTVRKKNGSVVESTIDELVGEKRDDGRFHVKLKDGSEGILLRKAELDEIEAKRVAGKEAMRRFLNSGNKNPDKRTDLQRLIEDWPLSGEGVAVNSVHTLKVYGISWLSTAGTPHRV